MKKNGFENGVEKGERMYVNDIWTMKCR